MRYFKCTCEFCDYISASRDGSIVLNSGCPICDNDGRCPNQYGLPMVEITKGEFLGIVMPDLVSVIKQFKSIGDLG